MEDTPLLTTKRNDNVKIFISYSSKDMDWMNELLTQLNVLTINDKQLEIWQDGLLDPGTKWDAEIKEKLYAANIVLMLISANFLTLEYVTNIEIRDVSMAGKRWSGSDTGYTKTLCLGTNTAGTI